MLGMNKPGSARASDDSDEHHVSKHCWRTKRTYIRLLYSVILGFFKKPGNGSIHQSITLSIDSLGLVKKRYARSSIKAVYIREEIQDLFRDHQRFVCLLRMLSNFCMSNILRFT
uniref:Uncharacterized protein n=1 Tax=Cacopsylla melanoneura TaxID=428564 RepID=A0A8D8ZBP3_9HEMI